MRHYRLIWCEGTNSVSLLWRYSERDGWRHETLYAIGVRSLAQFVQGTTTETFMPCVHCRVLDEWQQPDWLR